jgi:hypothetical protein
LFQNKTNKKLKRKNMLLMLVLASLSACVTINIYFPAAAAEKAADKIIDEVWQLQDSQSKPNSTAPASDMVPESETSQKEGAT